MSISIKSQIESSLQKNHVPHAILVEGLSPDKVTETITYIACALLCSDENNRPCGNCNKCRQIKNFLHPDVILVETSGVLNSFSIETIRKIKESSHVLPNEAQYKIYILNGADNMSIGAQNALLKILEEPPERVVFIIGVKNSASLLSTVRSRVTTFSLHDDLYVCDDVQTADMVQKISEALLSSKEFGILECSAALIKNKELFKNVIPAMTNEFRAAYVDICVNENANSSLARNLTVNQLVNMIDELNKSSALTERNVNHSLNVTTLLFKLRDIAFS